MEYIVFRHFNSSPVYFMLRKCSVFIKYWCLCKIIAPLKSACQYRLVVINNDESSIYYEAEKELFKSIQSSGKKSTKSSPHPICPKGEEGMLRDL